MNRYIWLALLLFGLALAITVAVFLYIQSIAPA